MENNCYKHFIKGDTQLANEHIKNIQRDEPFREMQSDHSEIPLHR